MGQAVTARFTILSFVIHLNLRSGHLAKKWQHRFMPIKRSFDVVIVGAGIAGCHLAGRLASQNISCALVDQTPLPKAGPSWINAVPSWMFDEARLNHPSGSELFDINDRFIIRAPDKKTRLVLDNLGVLDVHMGYLGERLKTTFVSQNTAHAWCASIEGCIFDEHGRLTQIHGKQSDGQSIALFAKLFVDASGLNAILRKSHPRSTSWWPSVATKDMCTASQRTLAIADRHGALNFLEKNQASPGDVVSDVGFAGGFSLFRAQIDKQLNHVSLLCGVRKDAGFLSANKIVNEFVENNSWTGKTLIDGRGAIPLNAPFKRLGTTGLALLGDSAHQIFAAHGSGIGFGLIAARLLSDAVIAQSKAGHDIGAIETISHYQNAFHLTYYQRLYFSEQFRKFTQNLDENATTRLIASGILGGELAKQTLRQEKPTLSFASLTTLAKNAVKSPHVFMRVMPLFKKAIESKSVAKRLC